MAHKFDFKAAHAAANSEGARHRETFEALVARHGFPTADAIRRMTEIIYIAQQMVPPLDIMQKDPEGVRSTLVQMQDKFVSVIAAAMHNWISQTVGHSLTIEEIDNVYGPEATLVMTLLAASETTILRATGWKGP